MIPNPIVASFVESFVEPQGGFKNGARTFQSAALSKERGVTEIFGAVEPSRIAADWKVRAPFCFLESAVVELRRFVFS